MIVTTYLHKCPGCGFPFAQTAFSAGLGVRLGPGYLYCRNCKARIDDGSKEWPDLSWPERVRLFLPRVTWPLLALIPLMGVWSVATEGAAGLKFLGVLGAGVFVMLPIMLSPWLIYRAFQVRASLRRVAGDAGAYQALLPAGSPLQWTDILGALMLPAMILGGIGYAGLEKYWKSDFYGRRVAARFATLKVGDTYELLRKTMGTPDMLDPVFPPGVDEKSCENPDGRVACEIPCAVGCVIGYGPPGYTLSARFAKGQPGPADPIAELRTVVRPR